MILQITDAEASALMQELNSSSTSLEDSALESAKTKLQAAMQESDAKLSRSLNYAISSLKDSGFDDYQLEALRSARDKAVTHNELKYEKKRVKGIL
jgi:hypothetical protein